LRAKNVFSNGIPVAINIKMLMPKSRLIPEKKIITYWPMKAEEVIVSIANIAPSAAIYKCPIVLRPRQF
jgi:hypothetical protein